MRKIVVMCSGGLDSSTLVTWLKKKAKWDVHVLFVNYGQITAHREYESARVLCFKLDVPFKSIIIDGYKRPGLEFFRMWETGIVEVAIDNRWDTQHYALSCSLAASMVTISNLVNQGGITVPTFEKIFMTAITGLASKKSFFFAPLYDEFMKTIGSVGSTQTLAEYMCSRCAIIPCTNRLSEFYNSKIFKKLIKNPLEDTLKK